MTGQSATAEDIARIESILGGTTGRERRVWAVARSLNMIRDTFGPAVNTTVYPTMTPHNIRGRKWNNGDRIVYLGVDWDLRLLAHLAHAGVPERYLPRHLAGREYLCECSECKPTPLQFAMRAMDEDDWLRRDVNQGRIIYHFTSPYTPNVRTVPPNAYNWSVES
jgi:hypothetical protein